MAVSGVLSGNIVQNVGDVDVMIAHHNIPIGGQKGAACYLGGFRLDGEFVSTQQLIENSTLTPLLGGGSIQLTNNNRAGRITFNTVRTGILDASGAPQMQDEDGGTTSAGGYVDIVSYAQAMQQIPGGDGVGATIKMIMAFNGMEFNILFKKCTIVSTPPIILAGNSSPSYTTVFNYAKPIITGGEINPADYQNELDGV